MVALGGTAEVTWRVLNPTGRAVRVALADELAPSLGARSCRARGTVPAGGLLSAVTILRPARRGRFRPGEVTVRAEGPLGLAARQRRRRLPGELRVYPAFPSREEAELRIVRGRILEVGLRSARGLGGGSDFDQLREYGVDDDSRRIDWAATARSGKAIVRTYRAERNQQVVVLLDCGRTMAGRVGNAPRIEHAMDAVMCLATVATRLGDRCGLVAFDREVRKVVPAGSRRDQVGRMAEAMFDLEVALVEADHEGAFAHALTRFRGRTLFVVVTDLLDAAVSEFLAPALPLLARRHLVVVAGVTDPEVEGWAFEAPEDGPAAYRSVAAVAASVERSRASARLRALGATVVDAPPGGLAARLTDAYLQHKATGRL